MKYQNRKLVTVHLVCVSIALCRCSSVPEEASRGIKSSTYTNSDIVEKDNSQCNITVQEEGANIFRGTLRKREPDFVQFKIKQIGNERHHENENVFQPFRWSWTYNDVAGPYPFISLNLDYGILSFHLLETKSLYLEHEIGLNVSDGCNITYGSYMTTKKIVEAFISLIDDPTTDDPPTYIESYFCQYQIDQSVFKPVTYILAQYFPTTVNPIIYNCTSVYYNYTSKRFVVKPSYIGHLPSKNHWVEGASLTQLMGILALLYCSPIIVFSIAGWMAKYEKIFPNEADEEYEVIGEPFEVVSCEVDQSADWIYSDGKNNPLNISDIFSLQRLGLSAKYPILVGSDGYMELLISAVDLSRQMNEYNEFIYNANGHVTIYCQRINNVKDIKINNQLIDVSPDILKSIKSGDIGKVQEKNGCFGIPKALFDILVQEFRPVHCELLSLAFKAAIIFTFVTALLNVSSTVNAGPTSEISEVMHVIFIVIVGALPRLVSSLLSHRNDVQLKEIEERQIREVILRYWNDVDREMEIRVS
ncbi:hypothetical protein ACF0H5_005900 [Mactra antiquata]